MALSLNTVFEVRSTGADTNGGGFVTGASGTDWSLQDAAQYSVTDAVTAGTTTITSATANFGTDVVGNILYIQGGTGSITAGWYQIASRTNSTTIVVDRSTGLSVGTGATLKIGGAFATIAPAVALMTVAGMTTYVKATATYVISAAINLAAASNGAVATRIIGYTTTRTDNGQATIQTSGGVKGFTNSGGSQGWFIRNFILDGNNVGTYGMDLSGGYTQISNIKITGGWTTYGIYILNGHMTKCEVTGMKAASTYSIRAGGASVDSSWIHDNPCVGIAFDTGGQPGSITNCVVSNCTGASTDGIVTDYGFIEIKNCIVYGSGRHGLYNNNSFVTRTSIYNSIFYHNGGNGMNTAGGAVGAAVATFNYNALGDNTSGDYSGFTAGVNDVSLSAAPFTNAAGNVFTLNTTAGGGAACRNAGFPGAIPGSPGTGSLDIGALQHADPTPPLGQAKVIQTSSY